MENIDILIQRSYKAIRKRGLITADTDMSDFIKKMNEELNEITRAYSNNESFDRILKKWQT